MKEDILEQIVDDWLSTQKATYTKHNIKYKPIKADDGFHPNSDAVHSDIDILVIHLSKSGAERVRAITCKSYQGGFNPEHWWNLLTTDMKKIVGGKEAWKHYRELCVPKWGQAFARKIFEETLSQDFTWTIVATKINCNDVKWINRFINETKFIENLKLKPSANIKIEILPLTKLIKEYLERANTLTPESNKKSTTLEVTQLGRLLQVLSAANIKFDIPSSLIDNSEGE